MTATSFSLLFSGCFVTLLIWAGHTTVVCLVQENQAVQPTTTTNYQPTEKTNNATHGYSDISYGCGNNSIKCEVYCGFCHYKYGEPEMMACLHELFQHICVKEFNASMRSLNSTDWCIWGNVSSFYSNLSNCTEEISDCLLIPWPNPLVEQVFVDIHSTYFMDCPTEELSDPPPVIVFALVITPICLIPAMVSLVVLKTKNGDGSS